MFSERQFVNISERYGGPEVVTLADYQELNPEAEFVIRGDEIREYIPAGTEDPAAWPHDALFEVVAREAA